MEGYAGGVTAPWSAPRGVEGGVNIYVLWGGRRIELPVEGEVSTYAIRSVGSFLLAQAAGGYQGRYTSLLTSSIHNP